jgi:uncharacterized protein
VVPLLAEQQNSSRVAEWFALDRGVAVWALTPVEVVSASRRFVREGALNEHIAHAAEARLDDLVAAYHIVIDVDSVKSLAVRPLRLHALRTFDALQLAAALHWTEGNPAGTGLSHLGRSPVGGGSVRGIRRAGLKGVRPGFPASSPAPPRRTPAARQRRAARNSRHAS